MSQKDKEEYYFLTEKLEEVDWALNGSCNDIDCDKYMYKDLLKKKYKPVLKHSYSCMKKLRVEKETILRLLSQKKFGKYRYEKCKICKKFIDKLNNKNALLSFTREARFKGKTCYEMKILRIHRKCQSKVKIPSGWKKN